MFFRKTASVLAPILGYLFRRLLRCGEFPLEWRIADVTPIPKGPLSALVCNYRPISITPVLSKVFERLIALRLGRFLERSGVLSSHQYSYRKGLGTCDALLDIVCAGLALVQIDFSAAFDRVNHGDLVFKIAGSWSWWLDLEGVPEFFVQRYQRVPHPRDRSSVAASLNDDLAVISDWCSRWGMLVNPSKTRGMLISRSCSPTW